MTAPGRATPEEIDRMIAALRAGERLFVWGDGGCSHELRFENGSWIDEYCERGSYWDEPTSEEKIRKLLAEAAPGDLEKARAALAGKRLP